ncbi:SDR family NAD(P)-dependent oxidoreductase [Actinacidiphila rubida]|uniref:NADP-dependent 3-hydroxy acid dehydrogenase YdfG n=1 Tax=Actinacidiphila rubida TaxID=310780 RepID=A0A1H8EP05_9ACTN|nr:SDR family oxidoreductase [Actinacidiphila rubida]SEN20518.1 NADP-dependent 3-hydroxy acid dehydrogenase YdfG [Actinacidiphila rubida]
MGATDTEFTGHAANGGNVLVVGGTRGIGLAIARRLSTAGHRVAAWSRAGSPDGDSPTTAVRQGRLAAPADHAASAAPAPGCGGILPIDFRAVDVRRPERVRAELLRAAAVGTRPDILVYCAAIVGRGITGEVTDEVWRDVFEVNATGARTLLDQYVRAFGAHPARVIGLSSEAARHPHAGRSAYAASKAALEAFLGAYREEARDHATTVTVLRLGKVNTTLSRRSPEANSGALQPADVADLVAALLALPPHAEVRLLECSSVHSAYG